MWAYCSPVAPDKASRVSGTCRAWRPASGPIPGPPGSLSVFVARGGNAPMPSPAAMFTFPAPAAYAQSGDAPPHIRAAGPFPSAAAGPLPSPGTSAFLRSCAGFSGLVGACSSLSSGPSSSLSSGPSSGFSSAPVFGLLGGPAADDRQNAGVRLVGHDGKPVASPVCRTLSRRTTLLRTAIGNPADPMGNRRGARCVASCAQGVAPALGRGLEQHIR